MNVFIVRPRITVILISIIPLFLIGCAATQVALEKKDLKVQTKMSKSIFLDLDNQIEKSAFIQVKNTSDKDIDLTNALKQAVRKQGYTLVDSAKKAAYIYQCNILYVGEVDPAALRTAVHRGFGYGYGATVGGAAAGGAIGYGLGGGTGAAIGAASGGLLASAAELITGSLTKDVTYTIMTDIQLTEKTTKGKKIHKARVASTAEQVNLEWEEAEGQLVEGLAKSLGGLL
jgi:outer membrane lipoprotein SlyB